MDRLKIADLWSRYLLPLVHVHVPNTTVQSEVSLDKKNFTKINTSIYFFNTARGDQENGGGGGGLNTCTSSL